MKVNGKVVFLKELAKLIFKMVAITKDHLWEESLKAKMGFSYTLTVLLKEEMFRMEKCLGKEILFLNREILDTRGNGLTISLTAKGFNIMLMDQNMKAIL